MFWRTRRAVNAGAAKFLQPRNPHAVSGNLVGIGAAGTPAPWRPAFRPAFMTRSERRPPARMMSNV
jgi:hypothetical protein